MIVFIIMLLALWLGSIPLFYCIEKRTFNNGRCRSCGGRLRHFDDDSRGGEGWCCDDCQAVLWLNWYRPKEEMYDKR